MLTFFLFFSALEGVFKCGLLSLESVGDAHKYVTQGTFAGDLDRKDHQQLKEAWLFLARRGSRGSSGTRYPYRGGSGAGRGELQYRHRSISQEDIH